MSEFSPNIPDAADAVNHLLMALDIGAGHVKLDGKGRRMDRDGYE
jgi:hypothetical protein